MLHRRTARAPDRGRRARACRTLGADLHRGDKCRDGALVASMLVSILVTPIVDRVHLPFAALTFSTVVSLMPGFFLFNAATGLVEIVSIGSSVPTALLTSIAANGAAAFLIIMAMTFGLTLPRMRFERVLSAPA